MYDVQTLLMLSDYITQSRTAACTVVPLMNLVNNSDIALSFCKKQIFLFL